MKDKDMLGFILIEIFLALGIAWGYWKDYKLIEYGLLVYFVINTLAILLKLANSKKDNDGDRQ